MVRRGCSEPQFTFQSGLCLKINVCVGKIMGNIYFILSYLNAVGGQEVMRGLLIGHLDWWTVHICQMMCYKGFYLVCAVSSVTSFKSLL